jgi:site-specific recombinase XerD
LNILIVEKIASDNFHENKVAFWELVLGIGGVLIRLFPDGLPIIGSRLSFSETGAKEPCGSKGNKITNAESDALLKRLRENKVEFGEPCILDFFEKAVRQKDSHLASFSLNDCIAEFSKHLIKSKKSHNTQRAYISDVKTVLSAVAKEIRNVASLDNVKLNEITKEKVEKVEFWLFHESNHKPRTKERIKHGWSAFCAFIGRSDWKMTEKTNVSCDYRQGGLSNSYVLKILDYCRSEIDKADNLKKKIRLQRLAVAINLGWAEGLRSSEYHNANFDEVEIDGQITIRGSKNKGHRAIPLSEQTIQAIIDLKDLLIKADLYPVGGGVFEKLNGSIIATHTIRRWLKKAAKACGVPSKLARTHGLRHSFAKNFMSYNKDHFMTAEIMGHKSIETTRIYSRPTIDDLRSAIQGATNQARMAVLVAA